MEEEPICPNSKLASCRGGCWKLTFDKTLFPCPDCGGQISTSLLDWQDWSDHVQCPHCGATESRFSQWKSEQEQIKFNAHCNYITKHGIWYEHLYPPPLPSPPLEIKITHLAIALFIILTIGSCYSQEILYCLLIFVITPIITAPIYLPIWWLYLLYKRGWKGLNKKPFCWKA